MIYYGSVAGHPAGRFIPSPAGCIGWDSSIPSGCRPWPWREMYLISYSRNWTPRVARLRYGTQHQDRAVITLEWISFFNLISAHPPFRSTTYPAGPEVDIMAKIDGFDSPREHYIQTDLSLSAVARAWKGVPGCSESNLRKRYHRDGWKRLRAEYCEKLAEKTAEKWAESFAEDEAEVRRRYHTVAKNLSTSPRKSVMMV